jgi:heptosyltransferase II
MKILIIQTAFIGDVILATALVESLHRHFPQGKIDFLLRKGNEQLLTGHPHLRKVLVWEKKDKYRSLFQLLRAIRQEEYHLVLNCQRFAASGFLTAFSGASSRIGFRKNPLSFFFSKKLPHNIGDGQHEIQRNHSLIEHLVGERVEKPRLYPAQSDMDKMQALTRGQRYVCIAPTSVWFTKQWPAHKWLALMQQLPATLHIYLLGGKGDVEACEMLCTALGKQRASNLAGKCSFLESAALMRGAAMNYVNDSGPMHIASAMNAPVIAVFCSTVPAFGFGPLSDKSMVVETKAVLPCRPCGLHGYKACPKGHFECAESIDVKALDFKGTALF